MGFCTELNHIWPLDSVRFAVIKSSAEPHSSKRRQFDSALCIFVQQFVHFDIYQLSHTWSGARIRIHKAVKTERKRLARNHRKQKLIANFAFFVYGITGNVNDLLGRWECIRNRRTMCKTAKAPTSNDSI